MKIYGIIRTVIYWALAALVIAFISPLAEIAVLRYFIGGLMIFYGAEEIILTVFKNKKHYSVSLLYWNIIEIVIGIILIVFIETDDIEVTYAVVCVSWACWSIIRETRELVEDTEKVKEYKLIPNKTVVVISIIESLTVIALSLTMLIEPGEHHAKIHLCLLSVELFTKVLFPAIHYIVGRYNEKKNINAENPAEVHTETEDISGEPSETETETETETESESGAEAETAVSESVQ